MASKLECTAPAHASGYAQGVLDADLWQRLQNDPQDRGAQEELVERHLLLVAAELKRISYHLPRHVDRDELYAEGLTGLLAAVTNFRHAMGVAFEAYARKRIWGSMMDRVRSLGGIPRSSRMAARQLTGAIGRFLGEHGRQPDEAELARALGVSTDDLHELERQAGLAQTLSLDHAAPAGDGNASVTYAETIADRRASETSALDRLEERESKALLAKGIKSLPDRERAVLVLYYHENLMLKEIAEAMNVSESRVSQLHNRAIFRLRAFVGRIEAGQAVPESAD
ncbi:MAG: FliA/WhiG family RNA polymerase sigma factor [Planctomycetota bacterium]|nr:FliA/WhiG family RNA polymerase sigma factor [Planctomycetota bacterium]